MRLSVVSLVRQSAVLALALLALVCASAAEESNPPPSPPPPPNPGQRPAPSDAFRDYINALRIDGVFEGDNPRIYIERRVVGLGKIVDAKLGITLRLIDFNSRVVTFQDKTGAQIQKSY
jgi:hypothetical protein